MRDPITAEDFRTVDDIVEAPLPSPEHHRHPLEDMRELEDARIISNTKLYIVIGVMVVCFLFIVMVAVVIAQLDDLPQRYGPSLADARFFPNLGRNMTNPEGTVTTLRPPREILFG